MIVEVVKQDLICGEGPFWDSSRSKVLWTDSGGKSVYSFSEKENMLATLFTGEHVASLVGHVDGGFTFCGSSGFFNLTKEGKVNSRIVNCDNYALTDINDIIADPTGRVYGGQAKYNEDADYMPGALYMVSKGGNVTKMDEGFHLANGMAFDLENRSFYVVDSISRIIYRYDYNVSTGNLSNKKILKQFNKNDGLPDGMTIDRDGFLWVAMYFGSKLVRLDQEGVIERETRLPFSQPTSLTFGGADMNELFVTSASDQWNSRLAPPEFNPEKKRGGSLYRMITEVQGRKEFLSGI